MEKIILASASPRRREILASAGIPFKIVTPDVDESCEAPVSPSELVMGLASRKLLAVKEKYGDGQLILAADTIVYYDGVILGKPKDKSDAFRMLTLLSGSAHEVYTGIALCKNGKLILDCDVARVEIREADSDELEAYIETGEPMGKAGAYAIQELGGVFVRSIQGDYHTVVGLPLCLLVERLRNDFNINIFD